jgi:hypothetical protein
MGIETLKERGVQGHFRRLCQAQVITAGVYAGLITNNESRMLGPNHQEVYT